MKRIIRNYVVRDPKPVMDAILRGVSNYTSITFKPSVDGQVIFEEIIDLSINDIEKTELYVNGIRYNIDEDYQIENKRLKWKGSFDLETSYNLVFISR
jgi:hypothetical protein